MKHSWPAQEARSKFNHVLTQALEDSPQVITQNGKEAAIVLSYEEYRKLTLDKKKLTNFP